MEILSVVRLLVVLLLIALMVIFISRRFAVPYTLGLVLVGLLISLFGHIEAFHLSPELVLFVFLPPLIFEGSWSISLRLLRENWVPILLLAVPGLLLELALIALPLHFFARMSWSVALLLAAILSPTDPVAVLGLFRQLRVNERLSILIEGESLFNDGVAGALYQVFLAIVLLVAQGQQVSLGAAVLRGIGVFILQAGGGILVGALCGLVVSRCVKQVNDHLIEMTMTIVTAYGVYLLADALHMSGILAVIVASLIMSNYCTEQGMSEETRLVVDDFWSMIAFLANALLFLLVGAQLNPLGLLAIGQPMYLLLAASVVVIAVLVARYVMILLLPLPFAGELRKRLHAWRFILFWSGLRGALSLALALALPTNVPHRTALIFSTYIVVLFTLLVQGFSIRPVLRRIPGLL
ncbi:cation:proton antiporter [Dictyobacter aurantiacus]|uniref:Cation/H+ exchanger transmembrane domain-containing protein n=1 Tax=Dictyobacter aurantiacus TaxID=1936993 RepID=A0A401ZCD1_9CHLR|nr:sodium:proton antiporter [Dictyobacter aurantiacus]GCE04368.1 hypothetical protein KDAU_16970 [Dictyobacter aurantiacus]